MTIRLLVEGGGSLCWVFLDAGPCNIFKQSQALPIYKGFINIINSKKPDEICRDLAIGSISVREGCWDLEESGSDRETGERGREKCVRKG